MPAAARWLGYAGLIPFVAAAVAGLVSGANDFPVRALVAYGAAILSFLGGVRWGLAMATAEPAALLRPLLISVLPSLAGWGALLLPTPTSLIVLSAAFSLLLLADLRLTSAPAWYGTLRVPLSLGSIASLLAGLVA